MSDSDSDQTQWRHDYDQRQYRQMLERLEAFEIGRLFISELIGDLDTLLNVLEEEVDETWASKFSGLSCALEEISASAIDRGDKGLSHDDMRHAREIAGRFKSIILAKIETSSSETIDE